MSKNRNLDRGDVLPASWTDGIQEFISTLTSNLKIEMATASSIRVPAGTGSDQVAIGIDGLWRYRSTSLTASMPSSTTGQYDIYVTATANSFSNSPSPDTDTTDYNFGLAIVTSGGSAPSGSGIVATRKIGDLHYDGTTISAIRQTTDTGGILAHAATHNPGGADALNWAALASTINLASTIASRPAPTSTNAGFVHLATDTGALSRSTGSAWVTFTDSTRAPLASPTLTGTPAAPTAAVDTNTTQLATTAYVIGQGYATTSSVSTSLASYAPLASPVFTGSLGSRGTIYADAGSGTQAATLSLVGRSGGTGTSTDITASTTGDLYYSVQSGKTHSFYGGGVFQGSVNATGVNIATGSTYQINGTALASTNLSDTAALARLAGPTFTGTPSGPTAAVNTNTTQLATTAYVMGQGYLSAANLSGYAPLDAPVFTTSLTSRGQITVDAGSGTASAFLALVGRNGGTAATTSVASDSTGTLYYNVPSGHGHVWQVAAGAVGSVDATGISLAAGSTYKINGTQISLANLSNGTTGTGTTVALSAGPSFTGTTTLATAAVTTFSGTPNFSGNATGQTAAVDTNTTQIATTAYVVGQGYLKSATATSTYAPIASPTLTGTPAGPTAGVDTNTTQLATTAYVVGQGYLKSAAAASTYAPLASPTFTGQVFQPLGTALLPGIAFTGDPNTGLYQAAASADTLSVAVGGNNAATFNAAGNLNVAGTITMGTALAVAQGGTGVTSSTGTGSVVLSASPTFTGTAIASTINAAAYQVGGVALSAANLSNGTTGSGNVALATGPTLSGATLNGTTSFASGQGLTLAAGSSPNANKFSFGDGSGWRLTFGNGANVNAAIYDHGLVLSSALTSNGTLTVSGTSYLNGSVNIGDSAADLVGFHGVTPIARTAYSAPSGYSTDRASTGSGSGSTTLNKVSNVLSTLIADLQAKGIIS